MATKANFNSTKFSFSQKAVPSGEDRDTKYASKKVLAKSEATGERRAPEFSLERMKEK